MSTTVVFWAQYTASKAGKTGLTPTIDVKSVKRSDGTITLEVNNVSMTELFRGLYFYRFTTADLDTYDYVGVASTSDTTVDLKEVPALWSRFGENAVVGSYVTGQDPATRLLDDANTIESAWTLRYAIRVILAAVAGKLSGAAGTTVAIRSVTDAKARITATVDQNGNRNAMSYDPT